MKLKPLYRVEFWYPGDWAVAIEGPGGTEHQAFYLSEGRCTGRISGRFQGANHPRRRTDHTYLPDFQGVILTDDGATIYFDYQGYGRAYPAGRRQIVAAAWHLSDDPRYRWLSDVVCVGTGEVRTVPAGQPHPLTGAVQSENSTALLLDIAELIWQPPAETAPGTTVP